MKELCWLLEANLEYATVKHPQNIGSFESTHPSLKQYLGIYEHKIKHDWHNYVDLAVFVQNTSYHPSIGCTPTFLFHGRQPITQIDLRFNNKITTSRKKLYVHKRFTRQNERGIFLACDARISS